MKQKTFLKWPEAKGMFLREKKNKNTRSVYDYALRQYRHGLRGIDRDVDPITGDFRAIRDAIKLWLWEDEATVKSATMECRLKGVRMFYTWLEDEGYRDDDPAAGIKTQKKDPWKPVEFPESELADKFLAAMERESRSGKIADMRDYLLTLVLRETGLRVSEMRPLRVQDIEFDTGRVHVIQGKGNKSRITCMTLATCDLAKAFAKKHGLVDGDFLFMAHWAYPWELDLRLVRAKPLSRETIFQLLQSRARSYGFSPAEVKLLQSPHGYRHLWTLEHVRGETDHITLTSMAGWSSPAMVMFYIQRAGLDVHAARR